MVRIRAQLRRCPVAAEACRFSRLQSTYKFERYALLHKVVRLELIKKIETGALLGGGLAATSAFLYDEGPWRWHLGLIVQNVGLILSLWFPYAVFFVASRILFRYRPRLPVALLSFILAVFMFIQTIYIYSYVLRGVKSGPTYEWLFTIPPVGLTMWTLLLLIGAAIIEGVMWLKGRRA